MLTLTDANHYYYKLHHANSMLIIDKKPRKKIQFIIGTTCYSSWYLLINMLITTLLFHFIIRCSIVMHSELFIPILNFNRQKIYFNLWFYYLTSWCHHKILKFKLYFITKLFYHRIILWQNHFVKNSFHKTKHNKTCNGTSNTILIAISFMIFTILTMKGLLNSKKTKRCIVMMLFILSNRIFYK